MPLSFGRADAALSHTFPLVHSPTIRWRMARAWLFACALATTAVPALAQSVPPMPDSSRADAPPTLELSGLAYFDYAYVLSSDDEDIEGGNSFDYRRIYFTADYTLSDAFSGRLRFEAQGASTTAQGRPAPFVKDAYLRWDGAFAEGHRLTLGVQPPPLFQVAERVWGYRSLAKTVLDRTTLLGENSFIRILVSLDDFN